MGVPTVLDGARAGVLAQGAESLNHGTKRLLGMISAMSLANPGRLRTTMATEVKLAAICLPSGDHAADTGFRGN